MLDSAVILWLIVAAFGTGMALRDKALFGESQRAAASIAAS